MEAVITFVQILLGALSVSAMRDTLLVSIKGLAQVSWLCKKVRGHPALKLHHVCHFNALYVRRVHYDV